MQLKVKSRKPYSQMTLTEVADEIGLEYEGKDFDELIEESHQKGFNAGSNVAYDGLYDEGHSDGINKYKDAIKSYANIDSKLESIKESYDEIKAEKEEIEEFFGIELLKIITKEDKLIKL